MADLDHALAEAIERYLSDNPGIHPTLAATGIVVLARGKGWRPTSALPPPPWKNTAHGAGLPQPGSDAAAEVARVRQQLATGEAGRD